MKKPSVLPFALAFLLVLAAALDLAAQGKFVAVPKGTKIEKLGPGSFKLVTPEGTVFKVTSYQKTGKGPGAVGIIGDCGILGDCGIYDAKGKLVATGTNAVLKHVPAAAKASKDIPPSDYVKIDDEITWLPATIHFAAIRIFDRQALLKLSPQPDPPGKIR
jgi:hypothetical protein